MMTAPGMDAHWEGQGRAGEDLVGPGRPHIGLPAGPRETGQAQANAKDRSAPGIHMWYTKAPNARPSPVLLLSATTYPYQNWSCHYPVWALHCLTLPSPATPVQFC